METHRLILFVEVCAGLYLLEKPIEWKLTLTDNLIDKLESVSTC